jgi:hypothetical protein
MGVTVEKGKLREELTNNTFYAECPWKVGYSGKWNACSILDVAQIYNFLSSRYS